MNIKDLLVMTHKILDQAGIKHALIGGLALGFHEIHRFTNDVDILIFDEDRLAAKKQFLSHGFQVEFESNELMQLSGIGNVDVLFARRELSRAMVESAEPIPDLKIPCCSAEDIIGLKIQAYCNDRKREFRDKADILALMEKHHAALDWAKIRKYAELFDEWPAMDEIRKRLDQ